MWTLPDETIMSLNQNLKLAGQQPAYNSLKSTHDVVHSFNWLGRQMHLTWTITDLFVPGTEGRLVIRWGENHMSSHYWPDPFSPDTLAADGASLYLYSKLLFHSSKQAESKRHCRLLRYRQRLWGYSYMLYRTTCGVFKREELQCRTLTVRKKKFRELLQA